MSRAQPSVCPRTGIVLLLLILGLAVSGCNDDDTVVNPSPPLPDLLTRLSALPGVVVDEIDPPVGSHFTRSFALSILQPVDHQNLSGQQFEQTLYISHAGFDRPTVIMTSGYSLSRNYVYEPSALLEANQVMVGHRYLAEGLPLPTDWTKLSVEQIAADYHRLIGLLKPIYPADWLSAGGSKGGITALVHRRFYPDDVVATVAYVAPIMLDSTDARFDDFLLHQVGDQACRDRIFAFQRAVLLRRDSLMPIIEAEVAAQGLTFRYGLDTTFEIGVLEYPFFFWQYGPNDCEQIPDSTNSTAEIYAYFEGMADPYWLDEITMDYYSPVFYQQFTELGYYGLMVDHVADLLTATTHPSYSMFSPEGVARTWHPEVMQDINTWLQTEGSNIIYVYGSIDPYTSTAIELTGATNALKVVEPGTAHGTRLLNLTGVRTAAMDSLEAWVGVEINRSAIITAPEVSPADRRRGRISNRPIR